MSTSSAPSPEDYVIELLSDMLSAAASLAGAAMLMLPSKPMTLRSGNIRTRA
jgi:hypothetical protein